jgi:hypothetical protein
LPPLKARFRVTDATPGKKPPRKDTPPAKSPPAVAKKVDDAEWSAVSYEALRKRLDAQMARPKARIRIPDWEAVRDGWPAGFPKPKGSVRIKWSLLTMGHQPQLSAAWMKCLRAFRQESGLNAVRHESMFWVVTRSLQCFY